MERKIVAFEKDEKQDWTAVLECGHRQHTRPPFEQRPWVISEEGRQSRIGFMLNCVVCDEEWQNDNGS